MSEIRSPIEAMYVAGKKDIPAEAEMVSAVSQRMYEALQQFDAQSALAGDPKVMTSMLKIGGEVYQLMRSVLTSLDHCAEAVIKTADDFVATDDQAARDYRQLGKGLTSADVPTHTIPPALPDLADPGAVNPNQPTRIGRGDLIPHDPLMIPSTPDPVSPEDDREQRKDTEDVPIVRPVGISR